MGFVSPLCLGIIGGPLAPPPLLSVPLMPSVRCLSPPPRLEKENTLMEITDRKLWERSQNLVFRAERTHHITNRSSWYHRSPESEQTDSISPSGEGPSRHTRCYVRQHRTKKKNLLVLVLDATLALGIDEATSGSSAALTAEH